MNDNYKLPKISSKLQKTLELASKGKYKDAISEVTKYIRMYPYDHIAYVIRGD